MLLLQRCGASLFSFCLGFGGLVGGGVIAVIEVVIGPMLAKLGRFKLDGGLILLSMFGGALGLGPGGLVLGPLVFRLAKEAAQLWRESAA